ncbi:MAG: SPOR domain-containing protein, partial [Thermoanaerobaculia bacterium]|nr:SPOR domain-containing protein [Thermoanaerobaculia bacterium]
MRARCLLLLLVLALAPTGRARETSPPSQTRAVPFRTGDWKGHEKAHVLHFSSYRERGKAEADASALAQRYGRPGYTAEIRVGDQVWYRVLLGGFATAEEALAFRDQLLAKGTPQVGFVYRIEASLSAETGIAAQETRPAPPPPAVREQPPKAPEKKPTAALPERAPAAAPFLTKDWR